MSSLDLDDTQLDRRIETLDSRYRKASLHLDLARMEYFQLKLGGGEPDRIARAIDRIVELTQERDALRAELDGLEDLH